MKEIVTGGCSDQPQEHLLEPTGSGGRKPGTTLSSRERRRLDCVSGGAVRPDDGLHPATETGLGALEGRACRGPGSARSQMPVSAQLVGSLTTRQRRTFADP